MDIEKLLQSIFDGYNTMLTTVFGENAPEVKQHSEYMANILDNIESLEDLQHIVTAMVSLPGIK